MYNELIKNRLGEQACSSLIKEKKFHPLKKVLDKLVSLGYNEPIKSEEWFLTLCLYALYNKEVYLSFDEK